MSLFLNWHDLFFLSDALASYQRVPKSLKNQLRIDVLRSIRIVILTVTVVLMPPTQKQNKNNNEQKTNKQKKSHLGLPGKLGLSLSLILVCTRQDASNRIHVMWFLFDCYLIWLSTNNNKEELFHQDFKQWGSLIIFGFPSSFLISHGAWQDRNRCMIFRKIYYYYYY